jgi:Phospholipase_D-nuclease N-terminal
MPLLDIFWTTLEIFLWVLWFMLLFRVYGDLFSRQDIGGWAKTGWVVLTLLMPFLGVFIYLISQGRGMAERAALAVDRQRAAGDAYIRSVAADASTDQLAKARDLLQSGAITPDEYQRMVPAQRLSQPDATTTSTRS